MKLLLVVKLSLATVFLQACSPTSADTQTNKVRTRYGVEVAEAKATVKAAERIRQLRIPMRDGTMLNADILFPQMPKAKLPTILIRTPYTFDGETSGLMVILARLLDEGYVIMLSHERGRFYSEGTYTFLNGAYKDGFDTVDWIVNQSWSSGKVGTIGCSSSAENQLGLAVMDHPGHVAMIPMAPGAGIGNVGPYNEQGNFYRGGAWQGLWFAWYYRNGARYKPAFPSTLNRAERERLSQYFDFKPKVPKIDMLEAVHHLPLKDLMASVKALPSDFDDFIQRLPNDPAWDEQAFVREGDQFGVPSLWVFSWYDIATPMNIAYVNHQRDIAKTVVDRENQFMVVGPTRHCQYGKETAQTIVGERNVGDARFDYLDLFVDWFDYWLKGKENGVINRAKNTVYTMGSNKWQEFEKWPPQETERKVYYLNSTKGANSRKGDGVLSASQPTMQGTDKFIYDPSRPVPSHGGSICCFKGLVGGALDQSEIELREDILVYTTPPFKEGMEVSGSIEVVLYISSNVPDTDLTVKVLVVDSNDKAYNLDDSIQRVRYRNGYETATFMAPGTVYKVSVGPMVTSNYFHKGQRLRIEISSSNFPRYGRNLNTGGHNFDETKPMIAHNTIHHSKDYPSHISISVR
ncbi:MAG: acylase [Alphaproteobacteria bacterium]|nr:MAG: acylase [Alphaproteobacteria bacterium]